MRLERITVQAFRGYPGCVDVMLSGNVILLAGENGTGKTSLTEAFEWTLFDSIVRKERSKTRGEYQGSSWIRSVHAPPELETYAEVILFKDDKHHVVRRTLVGNTSELTIDGKPATDVRVLGLRTEDAFRPFLGQCEIQALIDSEQQDRWEQLSAILGFAGFGQLRERLQRLRTDTNKDERVGRVRERVARAVQPLTPAGEDPLEQSPADLHGRAVQFLKLASDATWAVVRETAQRELDALLVKDRRPPGLEALMVGPADLCTTVSDTVSLTQRLTTEALNHQSWHEANQRSSFASQGLDLIDAEQPEQCPFCAHPTLDGDRIESLRAEAGRTSGPSPVDPRADFRNAISVLLSTGPMGTETMPALLQSVAEFSEADLLRAAEGEQKELDALRERARRLADAALAAYETASRPKGDSAALEGMAGELASVAEEVGQRRAALRAQLEAINLELTKRFSGLDEPDKSRMAALQRAVLLAENGVAVEAAWRIHRYQEQLKLLVSELEAAEKARMSSALQTLSGDIARYYGLTT